MDGDTSLIVQSVSEHLLKQISLKIGRKPDEIDIYAPFSSIGIKSKDLLVIVAELGNWIDRKLPPTLGFDYPTIYALANYLCMAPKPHQSVFPNNKYTDNCEQKKSEPNSYKNAYPNEPIAVIGIGCRFPGGCNTPESYWEFLENSGDGISEVPAERWDIDSFYDSDSDLPGKMNTRWGGFLEHIDQFDPVFFGISPREAKGIDPQQRLIMEVGWEALENAGEIPAQLKGSKTGVFIGISGSDYGRLLFKEPSALDLYSGTGTSTSIAANRFSYYLGLRGPSIAVDTACSSSLVAVDLACQSLNNEDCSMALAGGVNLILSPEMTIIFSKARLMSPDGRCKTFDSSANGYVRSEGCGIVVLKRYSDALKDGNPIYGLIRSTHVNQDGESNGLTVPNGLAQEILIRENLNKAGVQPSQIGYAETHGTGTSIGDPIEVNSLGSVLGKNRATTNPLIIGSVKTNIGHLEQAAGIAGLIKVLLSLKHNKIPPHLHFNKINPLISLEDIPAVIPQQEVPWIPGHDKRIATVSGFSFGGVNAHVVIEEAPSHHLNSNECQRTCHLLTLSARDENALNGIADQYKKYFESHPNTDAVSFCYTANACRSDFPLRFAVLGQNAKELENGLAAFLNKTYHSGNMSGKASPGQKPAFMFTGQGSQYAGMGRELYRSQPVFRKEMDKCNQILETKHQIPLLSLIYDDHDEDLLDQTANTQPALFSLEYSMARMYQSWGVEPSVVMGHSVGEYVAACIAGVFSLEDGLKLIAARGKLIQSLPLNGKMAVLFTNESGADSAIEPFQDRLSIAALNGPENSVISGDGEAVDQVAESLSIAGIQCVGLPVSHAFHSALMEPILDDFRKIASEITYATPEIPYVSNVTGQMVKKEEVCSAEYWCRHIRSTVKFESGIRALHNEGCRLYLEIGPAPVLTGMASGFIPKKGVVFASSLKRGGNDWRSVMESLGSLYVRGVPINWRELDLAHHKRVLSIPTYPFQRQRCWYKEHDDKPLDFHAPETNASEFHPLKGIQIPTCLEENIYQYVCNTKSCFLNEHRVYNHAVLSSSTMAAMVTFIMEEKFGRGTYQIENMFLLEALYVPENENVTIQVVFKAEANNKGSFKIFSSIQNGKKLKDRWNLHVEGDVNFTQGDKNLSSSELVFSPENIKKRCHQEKTGESLYKEIRDGGLELGNHFKWIEHIWRRDGEALAEMRLPDPGEVLENGHFQPGLIDSCIQLLFVCLGLNKKTAYMFLGFDRFTWYGRPTGRLLCHMELQTDLSEKDLVVGNYRLWSEKNELIAEATGVHLKQAPQESLLNSLGKVPEAPFYKIEWQLSGQKAIREDLPNSDLDKWLILADNYDTGLSLSREFESKGIPHNLVCRKNSAKEHLQKAFAIGWKHPDELEKLIAELLKQEKFSGIVNICGINKLMPDALFHDSSDLNMNIGCNTTLSLVRALSKFTHSDLPKLWLVTSGVQRIEHNEIPVNPAQSPLWGIGKVIALEHPEFYGGIVDLSPDAENLEFSGLMQELVQPDGENLISLRGDKRYLARLQPVEEKMSAVTPHTFSKEVTFLITGGLGGLGMGLAEWLSDKGAAHLVLMGRNAPSAEVEKNIRAIERKGVEIKVVQADVANGIALEKVFKDISRTMPPIKGIFHLAGVLDGGMLHQLEWSRFAPVMAPKMMGAWNLHMLTKNMHLDHFVLFSSIASLMGYPGQGGYAAANHFMDTLAEVRQGEGLPALSINWGPWSGFGMTAALKAADMERLKKGGITPLTFDQGFNFLEKLLGSGNSLVGVLDVNWHDYVRNYLNDIASPLLSLLVSKTANKSEQPKSGSVVIIDQLNNAKPEEKNLLVSEYIMNHVAEVMWLDKNSPVNPDTPLIEMGLDSLMVIELRNRFRNGFGVDLSLTEFLKKPTIRNLSDIVLTRLGESKSAEIDDIIYPQIIRQPDQKFAPFPLTDIQYAYWMGRNGDFSLGNVSCHVYPEVEIVNLDIDRLSNAVSRLVSHHEMLRAVILSDGRQQILEQVPPYEIKIQDLRGCAPELIKNKLDETRNLMSHQILPSETGPLFEIRASILDKGITRLHISFDVIIGDGWSFNILIQDLYKYYIDPEANLPPFDLTFRDYVLTQEAINESSLHQQSMRYWEKRLPELPPAPDLPLAKSPDEIENQRFIRLQSRMEKDKWKSLKKRAAKAGLTPSGVLLAAFSEILACWSKSPDFTINLTMFNRLPLHEQVNDIVGDFTTLTLLEINNNASESFATRARKIQERLWEDLEHRYVSGVEVLRELTRQRGGDSITSFPVVFTSVLPYAGSSDNATSISLPDDFPIDMVYVISQTPQVWLDHQIYEQNGALTFNWDVVEKLFPEGLLDDMFEAYKDLLKLLSKDEKAWNGLIKNLIPVKSPDTFIDAKKDDQIPQEMLHTLFDKQADIHPEKEAVVTSDKRLSYGELKTISDKIGGILRKEGALPGTLVGVVMEKGWEQVAGALGILKSGAAYLPIDPEVPFERLEHLLSDGSVSIVLTQSDVENNIKWPEHLKIFEVDKIDGYDFTTDFSNTDQTPDDLAYVIYTSGSTGVPKGVMIDHKSAVNTILDVNSRFSVTPDDKIFSLAAMNFDLSVYDIFGTLAAGATIVVPDHQSANDPAHWLDKINNEGITVWNSVPQLMQMLTEYIADRKDFLPDSLRLVMMSGDWIPLDLPQKIRTLFRDIEIISLGGATEASIWSIYYPINEIDPEWSSIPYGRSMNNQKVYVLNKKFDFCPVWVTGDLYIGGAGLAKGYWNDKEKTDASFVTHPETKERLYKTGDLGRYLPDGNIEFGGREDFQVKISGYRIELGEIEAAINTHSGIKESVVSLTGEAAEEKHIAAYVVLNEDSDSSLLNEADPSIADFEDLLNFSGKKFVPDILNDLSRNEYSLFYKYLEEISIEYICYAFNSVGIFTKSDEEVSFSEIMERGKIDKRFENLILQWIETLCNNELLIATNKPAYINTENYFKNNKAESLFLEIKKNSVLFGVVEDINAYLKRIREYFREIIQGETEVLELFFDDDNLISPERLSRMMPGTDVIDKTVGENLKKLCDKGTYSRPLKILETGARTGEATAALIPYLPEDKVVYTASDASLFFTDKMEEKFNKFSFISTVVFDVEKEPLPHGYQLNSFDIIITSNSLHRSADVRNTLKNIKNLLSPGGVLIVTESTINSSLQKISVGFIEEGFKGFEDERAESGRPLLSSGKWMEILESEGFEMSFSTFREMSEISGQDVIIAKSPSVQKYFSPEKINDFLKNKLPQYMIPSFYMQIPSIPLTSNGKVDRKALPVHYREHIISENEFKAPESEAEILLAKIWGGILKIDQISVNSNFFNIGGDSLVGTRIIAKVRDESGIDISLRMLFEFPTIKELSEQIESLSKESAYSNKAPSGLLQIMPDRDNVNKSFPVTDVQHAYLIGRSGLYELGKVGAHCYYEFEGFDPDIEKLTRALNRLICHHGMMRSIFLHDEMQQVILKEVPEYKIETYDLNNMLPKEADTDLLKIRGKMSHQIISTDKWPLFDIRVSLYNSNCFRLHISFDNSVFDGWSMFHLISEMSRLYKNPEESLPKLDLSFRDYVLAMEKIKDSDLFIKDRDYWLGRLDEFPPSPDLPMVKKPEAGVHYPFTRFEFKMEKNTWEKLKSKAKAIGITPSGLLLSAYAEILNSRSANNEFTINLTTFNRVPIHNQVNQIVGDFTSLTLLGVNNSNGLTFKERAKNLQRQLWQDMDHPYFSGVQVLRELAKLKGGAENAKMPIVFTSALGLNASDQDAVGRNNLGTLCYNISQTPQVLIDHQVYESSGKLILVWDTVNEFFPEGFIEDMFDSYTTLLNDLAQNKEIWEKSTIVNLPEIQLQKRIEVNSTEKEIPEILLHTMFEKNVVKNPLNKAVVALNKKLTYFDLSNYSDIIARTLIDQGAIPGKLVAIVMTKGWEQVAAVLGVLKSGAAYLPVSFDFPEERLKHILDDGNVNSILTQSWLANEIKWPENINLVFVDKINPLNTPLEKLQPRQKPDDLAYVIYTSGSTGKPKGVEIDHRGAVNTILDVNNRLSVDSSDRILMVSELNFDLSVYDIAGTLAAGGTIVIPDAPLYRDPGHWAKLIADNGITLWNSVPALFQMLLTHVDCRDDNGLETLRAALLSGDWIPPDLPGRAAQIMPDLKITSFGGATEASIWSICYPIGKVDPKWKNIPYGKPMDNQSFHVLNNRFEDCPEWVPGDLYIGGKGLAKGYRNDPARTDKSFISHSITGERIYKTGDRGRYVPDGNIEFLGRNDFQVKIRGHRIELAEIEVCLTEHPEILEAVVITTGKTAYEKRIAAHIVAGETITNESILKFISKKLPTYCMPSAINIIESIPVTANGKIDRKKLGNIKLEIKKEADFIDPVTENEQHISDIWCEILGIEKISVNSNYFELGGNSFDATRIIAMIRKKLHVDLPLAILFEKPTISALANFVDEATSKTHGKKIKEGVI